MKIDGGIVKERYIKKEEGDRRFKGWVWNGEILVLACCLLGEIRNENKRKRGADSHVGWSEMVSWKLLGKYLLCKYCLLIYKNTKIYICNILQPIYFILLIFFLKKTIYIMCVFLGMVYRYILVSKYSVVI